MSSEEKKRREEYKRKRKFWIIVQFAMILIFSIVLVNFIVLYNHYSQEYYYAYDENSTANYKVYINDPSYDDDFYKENGYLPPNRDYLSNIIDEIKLDLNYSLNIKDCAVKYEYSYTTNVYMEVSTNGKNSSLLYKHTNVNDALNQESGKLTYDGNDLYIFYSGVVDYEYYNDKAKEYMKTYSPSNASANLVIEFNITTSAMCNEFASTNNKSNKVSVVIPLNEQVVSVEVRGSVDSSNNKVLACSNPENERFFLVSSIVTAIVVGLLIIGLILYIILTRNTDINYQNKVNRIVNAYKSFIQKITNKFNCEGYQILYLETITELLEIRDTLQIPILMYENEDKTCSQFMIPSSTNILYMFEVKVDDYDELYKVEQTPYAEEVIKQEETVEETTNLQSENLEVDESGKIIQYNYSFQSKLILSEETYRNYYLEIVRFAKTYGVNVARSWDRERIYVGRKLFASLQYRGKTLIVGFPIDPADSEYAKYHLVDMKDVKRYQAYPAVVKVTSKRKVKYVIEILDKLFKVNNIENKHLDVKDEKITKKSKNTLIKNGLIKKGK